ncbi:hypothetical protein BDV11DRAFT_177195 [Aspergillus similis]
MLYISTRIDMQCQLNSAVASLSCKFRAMEPELHPIACLRCRSLKIKCVMNMA